MNKIQEAVKKAQLTLLEEIEGSLLALNQTASSTHDWAIEVCEIKYLLSAKKKEYE